MKFIVKINVLYVSKWIILLKKKKKNYSYLYDLSFSDPHNGQAYKRCEHWKFLKLSRK